MPMVVSREFGASGDLSSWDGGVCSSISVPSRSSSVVEKVMSGDPNGARIEAFSVIEMRSRMSVIHGYLSSIKCRPCFHAVARVNLEG